VKNTQKQTEKQTVKKTMKRPNAKKANDKPISRPMPFLRAFHEALDWALDIAVSRCKHRDDIASVERVRSALRARIEGRFAPVSIEDLLFACDLLIATMEADMHPITREQLGY